MGKAGVVVYRVLVVVLLAVIAAGQIVSMMQKKPQAVWVEGGLVEVKSLYTRGEGGLYRAVPLAVTTDPPVLPYDTSIPRLDR